MLCVQSGRMLPPALQRYCCVRFQFPILKGANQPLMKKTFKKLFAVLLAAALVLTMAVPAFAASSTDTKGSITIDPAVVGEEYTIYKMFDLNSFVKADEKTGTKEAYTYTVVNDWAPFFAPGAEGSNYITLDAQNHPTWKEEADVIAFAKAALKWVAESDKNIHGISETAGGATVKFSNLDLGYYLVDSSLGALCGLTNTDPNANVIEKNGQPTIEKKILDNGEVGENTAKIGDTINYQVKVKVEAGAKSYKVTDTMSKGLTYAPNSLKVNSKPVTDDIFETKVYNTAENGITTITLEFKDSYIADNVGQTITLTYSATLNKDAVIDGDGNTNKAVLSYGNDKTVESQTTTKSLQFDLIKVDSADNKLLDGAEFELYESETSDKPIKFVLTDKGYRVANGEEQGAASTIAVNKSAHIYGLDKTVYYLKETKAPDGYNQLTDRQMVDLSKGSNNTTLATGAATWNDNGGVVVRNNAGATLPSTGGMGTTLFYVIGGGLMVAAAVLLITKKRMERKN